MSLNKLIIAFFLKIAAKILLFRKKPEVIAITGSAGKTTTKEFIKTILSEEYEVLAPEEGYNTEIGAPLFLFSEKIPSSLFSIKEWLVILLRVYAKALFIREYPEKIVVEMGADKPGDIRYLVKVFKPQKAVVLSVLPVHLEEFKSIEAVASEKSELVMGVPESGTIYLNFDDPQVRKMAEVAKAKVVFFGAEQGAAIRAEKVRSDLKGTSFILDGTAYKAPIFGRQMIYPMLAAILVAFSENIPKDKVRDAVKKLSAFKGRMNIIEGKKGSLIIDDSYNANPASMILALNFLSEQKGRRIALLGNMNELGSYEREGHELVGRSVAKSAELLITVGSVAGKYIVTEALANGMNKSAVKSFNSSQEAGEYLARVIKPGDVILAKGSQNMVRIEQAVEQLMLHPEKKEQLLVRQGTFWKEK